MSIRYIPNLRWKRGEKNALRDLSVSGKTNVYPLFLLDADQFKPKKATKKKAEIPAPESFAQEVADCWGSSPFYLDASSIADTPGHPHRLNDIGDHCRAKGLKLIPVLRTESTKDYLLAVKGMVDHDKRGVCLRISLDEMSEISKWIGSWPFPLEETDLVVDYLNQAATLLALGAGVLSVVFQNLQNGSQWRSVTIVGTSIPDNFTGLGRGLHTIPRAEMSIWEQLQKFGLPYSLDFGDYATVSTMAAPPGIAWGFPITIKYTLKGSYLICRGVKTLGLGAEDSDIQLIGHANSVSSHPARGALTHCWGDKEINDIAGGIKGPKGLEHWVRIGVNRHIELVRSMLP